MANLATDTLNLDEKRISRKGGCKLLPDLKFPSLLSGIIWFCLKPTS
jgi:hypothetical protein